MKKYCPFIAVAIVLSVFSSCSNGNGGLSDDFVVGIAWTGAVDSGSLNNVQITLDSLGVKNVLLPEVVDSLLPYSNGIINSDCIDGNDILRQNYAVIFPGGEDIAPTLYNTPEPWHGIAAEKDYNATLSESTEVVGCPSWHHQAVAGVDGTNLVVSGTTVVCGIEMIEGIERSDKKLAVGIQYHPEAAYVKSVKKTGNAEQFMSKEQVATFFLNFIDRAK